jgi:Spx/MgsR family transcriptional regulator
MVKSGSQEVRSPSQLIDARIKELRDWRGKTLALVRNLIKQADPEVVETWKWRGIPVWEHDGIICTGETYKAVVKMTFAKGASLTDHSGLFNSSLEGNTRRAIDLHEGDKINEKALKALIRAALALNTSKRASASPVRSRKMPKSAGGTRMPITIYGIKNCYTMKKARAWLDKAGVDYEFHDYKTKGIERENLEKWAKKVGWETLLNRAGTTFKKLSDKDKEAVTEKKAVALMLAQPSMIKRPVLDLGGGKLLVGFKPEQYAASLG